MTLSKASKPIVRTFTARQPGMIFRSKAMVTPGMPQSTAAKAVYRLFRASVSRLSMGICDPVNTTGFFSPRSMKDTIEAV